VDQSWLYIKVADALMLHPLSRYEDSTIDSVSCQHGNIHILRVPPGKLAKVRSCCCCVFVASHSCCRQQITLNNEPYILESRREPYVFRNALFNFRCVLRDRSSPCLYFLVNSLLSCLYFLLSF
jgi:hypothetical protein